MADHGITQEDLKALRREVQEAKWLAYSVLQHHIGKGKADDVLAYLQQFIEQRELEERWASGMPVYRLRGIGVQGWRLTEADLYTVEEVAAKPRAEVAALPGVGRATLRRVETAMAERGLSWAEAA